MILYHVWCFGFFLSNFQGDITMFYQKIIFSAESIGWHRICADVAYNIKLNARQN